MDQDPFAVLADGDGDRLHRGLTIGRAISRVDVEVTGPQAVRAMVSMGSAGRGERDVKPAMDAAERFGVAIMATLTLGSRQLDSVSGEQDRPSDRSVTRSGQRTTVPAGDGPGSRQRRELRAGGPPEA
jgi:hypothetical protein